jgi:hypothetical protein
MRPWFPSIAIHFAGFAAAPNGAANAWGVASFWLLMGHHQPIAIR